MQNWFVYASVLILGIPAILVSVFAIFDHPSMLPFSSIVEKVNLKKLFYYDHLFVQSSALYSTPYCLVSNFFTQQAPVCF